MALAKIRFLQLEMGQRTPDTTTSMVMTALTSSKSAGLAQKYWADTEMITYTQPLTVAGLTITGYTESRTTITLQSLRLQVPYMEEAEMMRFSQQAKQPTRFMEALAVTN